MTAIEHVIVRPEHSADRAAVRAVNEAAFDRSGEADLIDRLRAEGAVLASFVAARGGAIVGHIVFSRMWIDTADEAIAAVALAPMAVLPREQRQGVGARLIRHGLESLHTKGERVVIVLGHPQYYPRFGFSTVRARGLSSPFPPDAFMALELMSAALEGVNGTVRYPDAFGLVRLP